MTLFYSLKINIFIALMLMMLCSCAAIKDQLSCKFSEIDCYRLDYSSIENFTDSVEAHALSHNLQNPSTALSQLTINKEFSIDSLYEAEKAILTNPEDIYVLGKSLIKDNKPREWLFVSEQAFLRSWNNLSR